MSYRTCSIVECGKPLIARGLCRMHYQRWKSHGSAGDAPPLILKRNATPLERIQNVGWIETASGCWEWAGTIDPQSGYGVTSNRAQAHRVAFAAFVGPIPLGEFILHRCDNRPCINPSHLFAGDHQANMDDMNAKGRARHPLGENHGLAKLTDETVATIRALSAQGQSRSALAAQFSIHKNYVSRIVNFRTRVRPTGYTARANS